MQGEAEHEFLVEPHEVGCRLDVFLVRRIPGLGRAGARELVARRGVRVDGNALPRGARLRSGQRVELVQDVPLRQFLPAPEPELALSVVHEDSDFVAVGKPAGMPCHPLRPDEAGTLVAALLARYPEVSEVGHGQREAGLVHRLDIGTSGLVICARTPEAFDALTKSLSAGQWDKRYQALVHGHPTRGARYAWRLAPDADDARRVRVVEDALERAWDAETELLDVTPAGTCAWIEVRASRARRHQVRVHLAHAGHPLLGDTLYGAEPDAELSHHALHASAITLPHPGTGARVSIQAPPSAMLVARLANLRS